MSVEKMSLSFPERIAKVIRRESRRSRMSASAWVAQAVEREGKVSEARRLLQEFEKEHGEITEEELARLRKVWPE